MNASLRIMIRAITDSTQLAALEGRLTALEARAAKSRTAFNAFRSVIAGGLNGMEKFGKNLQWVGRQIEFNFTLPIAAAGVAATKFFFDVEKESVRLRKVYGDLGLQSDLALEAQEKFGMGTEAAMQYASDKIKQETEEIGVAMRVLSDHFGVAQAEAAAAAAAFGQAGASGVAVPKLARLAIETSILGEIPLEDATRSLIAVQQQYGLSTDQLREKIALLNVVENETSVDMRELLDAMQRSGGVARAAGMDVEFLAAMVAALVPAAGSGIDAGNGLKTMISRLHAPTNDMVEVLDALHINLDQFKTSSVTDRLYMLAEGFKEADTNTQGFVSKVAAGRWQINRFSVLMEAITSDFSNFNKALAATGDIDTALAQFSEEVKIQLQSSPQMFKIAMERIRNVMIEGIAPMIPVILSIVDYIARLAQKFSNLADSTKQMIVFGAAFLAVMGPLLRTFGATVLLVSQLGKFFLLLSTPIAAAITGFGNLIIATAQWAATTVASFATAAASSGILSGAMAAVTSVATAMWTAITGPAGIAIGVIIALGVAFRDEIGAWWSSITQGVSGLPGVFVAVFRSLLNIVRQAVMAIWDWLSYLNPFARHSPSLVEQVQAGVDIIAREYESLGHIGSVFRRGVADLKAFMDVTDKARQKLRDAELTELRSQIISVSPEAGPAVDNLIRSMRDLDLALADVSEEFLRQEAIVEQWRQQLEAAEEQLEAAEDVLDSLQDRASELSDSLSEARERLSDLTNTPIEGMQAMSDAIFENEMAQKRLRLEMLRLEEAGGPVDDLRDRLADLAGDLEQLRGRSIELRFLGAGSDVLDPLESQIAILERERSSLGSGGGDAATQQMENMRKELERLQREGEKLDLEESLQFDPLRRQIEQVTNAYEEMPFDELLNQIKAQQSEVLRLEQAWESADAAVKGQEKNVDALRKNRERIADLYDDEREALDRLGKAYDGIERQISEMESAMNDLASAAQAAASAAAKVGGGGGGGGGLGDLHAPGDFPDVGGDLGIGREEGMISALLDQWEKEFKAGAGDFNPGKILGDQFKGIGDSISGALGGINWGAVFGPIETAVKGLAAVVLPPLEFMVDNIRYVFETLGRELVEWARLLASVAIQVAQVPLDIIDAFGGMGAIAGIWNALWDVVDATVGTVIRAAVDAIAAFSSAIRSIIEPILTATPVLGALAGVLVAQVAPAFLKVAGSKIVDVGIAIAQVGESVVLALKAGWAALVAHLSAFMAQIRAVGIVTAFQGALSGLFTKVTAFVAANPLLILAAAVGTLLKVMADGQSAGKAYWEEIFSPVDNADSNVALLKALTTSLEDAEAASEDLNAQFGNKTFEATSIAGRGWTYIRGVAGELASILPGVSSDVLENAEAWKRAGGASDEYAEKQAILNLLLDDVSGATHLTSTEIMRLADTIGLDLTGALDGVPGAFEDANKKLREAGESADFLATVSGEQLAEALTVLGDESSTAAEKVDALGSALDAILGMAKSEGQLIDNLTVQLAEMAREADKGTRAWEGNAEAAAKNRTQLRGMVGDLYSTVIQLAEGGASADTMREQLARVTGGIENFRTQTGLSREQLDQLITSTENFPPEISTMLETNFEVEKGTIKNVEDLLRALDGTHVGYRIQSNAPTHVSTLQSLRSELAALDRSQVSYEVIAYETARGSTVGGLAAGAGGGGAPSGGKSFSGRAAGGPVWGGQPYIVGERGREMFIPGMSGFVIPHTLLNRYPQLMAALQQMDAPEFGVSKSVSNTGGNVQIGSKNFSGSISELFGAQMPTSRGGGSSVDWQALLGRIQPVIRQLQSGIGASMSAYQAGEYSKEQLYNEILHDVKNGAKAALPAAPSGNRPNYSNVSTGGQRVINFFGDLAFPNIRSSGDAQDFIRNLEQLAKS